MARKKKPDQTPVEPIVDPEEVLFEEEPVVQDIPPLDVDLTDDQKKEFIKLLDEALPVSERAVQLAKLARFTDQKRAAVALRAILEINTITGLTGNKATEAAPMFILPEGIKIGESSDKVEK